ncbi:sulfur carrier protein ThiS [Alloacidobacterium dinghuense]|uniref:Sulfur carrier protein ThiS n=1 Tax=Alloacidobacterium dinghuense TaxID=2763107 RepID=A0A7G8BM91_9BACT|nr:sulfur carrier protein ThiS [Alloacidobacterium dinghuense]QNI33661.1 sulfur carrier protein ThiS [Alloacidobacterium dinghuense]
MQLVINGQPREFSNLTADARVADLVVALGLKNDRVAIEQNGEIVSRSVWSEVTLRPGDKFEIVHFVGGGRP